MSACASACLRVCTCARACVHGCMCIRACDLECMCELARVLHCEQPHLTSAKSFASSMSAASWEYAAGRLDKGRLSKLQCPCVLDQRHRKLVFWVKVSWGLENGQGKQDLKDLAIDPLIINCFAVLPRWKLAIKLKYINSTPLRIESAATRCLEHTTRT